MKENIVDFNQFKAMKDAKWIETEQRFKYPDIMRKSITETEENLYEIYSYSWNKVELCWFWAGAWATEDIFFVKGEIAPDTRIKVIGGGMLYENTI